ncbi:MAG: S1 RNA-binding domain-containing protein [Oscillospiraceae bacterium]|nr:S1 RNA-binding domain-containing protein [Oscillospiraceae bacterium]
MAYLPEGMLIDKPENRAALSNISNLREAAGTEKILEARAIVCDINHNLIVDLNGIKGIIKREDGAIGIDDGTTRDIALISRVNKPVCFVVTGFAKDGKGVETVLLSRKKAQESCRKNYVDKFLPGDIICTRVTHLEPFGCFVDIACGIPSLIPIDSISVSRISHPGDRFAVGQDIYSVVKNVDENGKISLTHKELLGTWEQNADRFCAGETVSGIVRSVESYGIFVELTPNLAGLAELKSNIKAGERASVYIKSIIPEKMKIKLFIVDSLENDRIDYTYNYKYTHGRIRCWKYSPESSEKQVGTEFY